MASLAFFIEGLVSGKDYTQENLAESLQREPCEVHDDPILQMRKLRLEKGKSPAQKDKDLEFKYRSVHFCAFGVMECKIGFWR